MHFASMSLGIFDFLIEWLTQFIMWVVGWVFDLFAQLFAGIFFGIATNFLEIVDFIQKIFRKLCGMDTYWVNGQAIEGVDPLLEMFTNSTVTQVLIALSLVAVVMVVVASIIQIIRTEFSTEGSKNTKGAIFGQALKSLLLFFIVPVCCIGGVGLTNALLKTIDKATNPASVNAVIKDDAGNIIGYNKTTPSIGASIFVSSVYGTNKVRNGNMTADEAVKFLQRYSVSANVGESKDSLALKVDEMFRGGIVSYTNKNVAKEVYEIVDINFILFIGGGIVAAYTLIMAAFGMIMRLFKGVVLFMISPPMVALMPLDGGSAFKQWRTGFLKQVLAAYGTVIGLNLLFLILPVIGNINLFNPAGDSDIGGVLSNNVGQINGFVNVLITLTGLFMLKDIAGLISNMIGADDAGAAGAGMAGKVGGAALKVGMVAAGGAGLAMKGLGAAAGGLAKATGSKTFGAIGNSIGGMGNKMTQKAKGTIGGALNKGMETFTGGASKDVFSFSDEKNYDKAMEAKEKKIKDRKDRVDSGQGGIKDNLIQGFSDTKFGESAIKVKDHMTSGGTSTIKEEGKIRQATAANKEALPETLKNVESENAKIFGAKIKDGRVETNPDGTPKKSGDDILEKFGKIVDELKSADPDSLVAGEGISEIVTALNSIADKTEDQKDLIQKLTTLQGQIASANGDAAKLQKLGNSEAMKGIKTTANAVKMQSEDALNVTTNANFDINAIMTKSDDKKMMEEIKKQVAKISDNTSLPEADVRKIVNSVVKAQKAQLETMKAEKEKK